MIRPETLLTIEKYVAILVSSTLLPPSPTPSKPTILPICGSNPATEGFNGFSKPLSNSPHLRLRYQPSHIGVLPPIGGRAQLILSENITSLTAAPPTMPSDMIHSNDYPTEDSTNGPIYCSIRLEACASCIIGIDFESPSLHFSEYEIEKVSQKKI